MKKYICIIFVLSFIVLDYGCITPAPIYTIRPMDSEIKWASGVGLINKSDSCISILVGFIENKNNLMCFKVIIRNESQSDFIVDPAVFECIPDNNNTTSNQKIFFAIDPEKEVLNLDGQISKEKASFESYQVSHVFGSFFNFFIDVATIGKSKTEDEMRKREYARKEAEESYDRRKFDYERSIYELENLKHYWQSSTQRKTTLEPGNSTEGIVHFNFFTKTKSFKLRFPIASSIFTMQFEQTEHKIK